MGGLNANLILQGTPTTNPTLLATPAQNMDALARIRQYQQQQAMAPLNMQEKQQQIQQNQNELDQQAQARADQATVNREFHNPDNMSQNPDTGRMTPDHDKVRAALEGNVSTATLQGLDADYLKMQQGAMQLATSKAKNDQDRFLNTKNLNQMAGEALAAVLAAAPEDRQATWDQGKASLKQAGYDTSKLGAIVPDDNGVKSLLNGVGYMGQILTNADKAALEEQRKAKAAKDQTTAKRQALNDMHAEAATDAQGLDTSDKDAVNQFITDFEGQDADHKAYSQQYLRPLAGNSNLVNILNRRALTAEQRTQADQQTNKPDPNPTEAALAVQAAKGRVQGASDDDIARGKIAEDALARMAQLNAARNRGDGTKVKQQQAVQGIANRIITESGGSIKDAYFAAQKNYQDDDDVNNNRSEVIKYLGNLLRQSNLNTPKPPKPSWRDRLGGGTPDPSVAAAGTAPQSQWKENDVVQNKAGDKLIMSGGKWVPAVQRGGQWVPQQ